MNSKISLKSLKEYLRIKGWAISRLNDKANKITAHFDDEDFELIIPESEDLFDYDFRIKQLVRILSSIENRAYENIANNIENIGFDIFQIRIMPTTNSGSIPLDKSGDIVNNIRDIIKYGACSEINLQGQYTGAPYDEARELIEHSEFGQTEKGSFIFNIKIPFTEKYKDLLQIEQEDKAYIADLGRKTLVRIITGISEAKTEKVNLTDEKLFEKTYDKKLNSNVCSALDNLLGGVSDTPIEFNAKFNEFKPLDFQPPAPIQINQNDRSIFKKMTDYLKKFPDEETKTISGKIIDLKETNNVGTAVIYDEQLKRRISIMLKDEHRKIAAAFWEKRIASVTTEGKLKKDGTRWILEDYTSLQNQTTINAFAQA